MPFAFGGVRKDFSRKHLFHHSTRSSWSLLNLITCLFMQALPNSIRYAKSVLLRSTWVFSLVMRIYRSQCIDRVWRDHLVRARHLLIYYLWMSPEWTTVCNLTAHDLKELQFSFEVWGYHPSRGKPSLSPFRWCGRYAAVTSKPTSGKHQWYAGWEGQLTYWKLIV